MAGLHVSVKRVRSTLLVPALIVLGLVAPAGLTSVSAAPAPSPSTAARLVMSLERATGGRARIATQPGSDVLSFVGGSSAHPLAPPSDAEPTDVAAEFIDEYAPAFGVEGPGDELVEDRTSEGSEGTVAVRYQQTFEGVPVLAGEVAVAVDGDGQVVAATGEASADLALSTTPVVSADAARATAIHLTAKRENGDPTALHVTDPQQWIYDPALLGAPDPIGPRLVWRVEVRSPSGDIARLVLVDAMSGSVALTFSERHDAKSVEVCDRFNAPSDSLTCGPYVTNPAVANAAGGDMAAAFNLSSSTHDYYANTFGRDSLDGAGLRLRSIVRFCPEGRNCITQPFPNAFWTGPPQNMLVYGAGFVVDDVVAHELTHGVTQFESGLFYYAESGAINESLSDVFGELFDQQNPSGGDGPGDRWLVGEQVAGFGAIRDMANPSRAPFNDPDRMRSPMFWGAKTDDHGVHINSGVNNKAAFLMTDGGAFNGQSILGLGPVKTAKIYYEAQTTLLGPGSDYLDLSVILPQACTNLIATGATTAADCAEVQKVVLATEMHLRPVTPGASLTAPACDAGTVTATQFSDDMENGGSGKWVFEGAPGSQPRWEFFAGSSQSGVASLHGLDVDVPTDTWARTASPVTVGAATFVRFDHSFSFEYSEDPYTYYDAGVVEYSSDLVNWSDAATLPGARNGYPATIFTAPNGTQPSARSRLEGRQAFAGTSPGYQQTRIDLSPLAGRSVFLRFRTSTDLGGSGDGWFIDDVSVYTCSDFVAAGPARLLDTRPGQSPDARRAVAKRQVGGGYVLEAQVTDVPGIVPGAGVGAVALNIAVTGSREAGFVTAYPCGARPFASSVNHVVNQTVSNGAIVPVSPTGTVCFYSLVPADIIVDVNGWFPAAGAYHAVGPARVFDTRAGESPGALRAVQPAKVGGGYVLEVKMTDLAGTVPDAGVAAVSLNVVATGSSDAGFVTAYPCGERPLVASVNHGAGETVANGVIAPVSATGTVCFFSLVETDLVVDLNGWFGSGSGYVTAGPQRVFDTRPGESPAALRAVPAAKVGGTNVLEVKLTDLPGIPGAGVTAVVLNVAVTGSVQGGFVTAYPCGVRPLAASVNHAAAETVSNIVIAPLSPSGTVCFYSLVPVDLIVDVQGFFKT